MEKNIKISIIIPIYNCSKYLNRCVDSVINQKADDYELILIDDGATDESGKICDEYAMQNEKINVIHKSNTGVSDTRNVGLNNAKGKYIFFMDSDDYLSDGFFEEITSILNKYPNVELLNFAFLSEVDNENLETISSDIIKYKECYYSNKEEITQDFVELWDNTMLYNIWNKIYLKSIIEKNNIRFQKENWGEDVQFNRLYLNNIETLYNSEKPYYHYIRERKGSITKTYNPQMFEIRKKEFDEFNEYFEEWNISKERYYEFSSRRYIERVLGCIESVFSSDLNFKQRRAEVKKMINDEKTREALKYTKPKSKKIKIMLIPIKIKCVLMTMIMGKMFNIVKNKFPNLFNTLKNKR